MEWRHSGSPRPKIFRVQKDPEKFLDCLDFLGSRQHPPYWLCSKGPNYKCGALLSLTEQLKEKRHGNVAKGVLFLHDTAPAHRVIATQKKLSYRVSKVLVTHPIVRIWPRRTTTCSLDWKTVERSPFFSYTDVIAAAETWLGRQYSDFWSGLQKLE
jgi:hypothetical protein